MAVESKKSGLSSALSLLFLDGGWKVEITYTKRNENNLTDEQMLYYEIWSHCQKNNKYPLELEQRHL